VRPAEVIAGTRTRVPATPWQMRLASPGPWLATDGR
jgi:hypothetical protein